MKIAVAVFTLLVGHLTNTIAHGKSAPSYDNGTNNGSLTTLRNGDIMSPQLPARSNLTVVQNPPKRCDVLYDGRCFIVNTVVSRLSLGQARHACQEFGGKLADIYSEEHFNLIRAFMRSMTPMGYTYNDAWTGMEVDAEKRRIKTSTGEWAQYAKWHKNHPLNPPRPYVPLTARVNNDGETQGFWDAYDTAKVFGCICQL